MRNTIDKKNEISEKALAYHFRQTEILRQSMRELAMEGLEVNYV